MSKEPTITHQAIELHPHGCGLNVTRCWSKWTDGTITHSDSKTFAFESNQVTLYINIGMNRHLLPPPGVEWIETAQPRETDT